MQSRISWTRAWSSALGQAADSFWPDMVRVAWVVCVVEESRSENARVHCGCSPRREFVEEQGGGDLTMQIQKLDRRPRKKKKRAAGPSFERCPVAERSGVHPTAGLPNATGGSRACPRYPVGGPSSPPRNTSSSKAKPISNRQPHTAPVSIAAFNHDAITHPPASPSRSRSFPYPPFDSARTNIQNVDRSLVSPNQPCHSRRRRDRASAAALTSSTPTPTPPPRCSITHNGSSYSTQSGC